MYTDNLSYMYKWKINASMLKGVSMSSIGQSNTEKREKRKRRRRFLVLVFIVGCVVVTRREGGTTTNNRAGANFVIYSPLDQEDFVHHLPLSTCLALQTGHREGHHSAQRVVQEGEEEHPALGVLQLIQSLVEKLIPSLTLIHLHLHFHLLQL